MEQIPTEWLREKTTIDDINRDWAERRKKHDWWCPSPPEWNREWEDFMTTLRDGDELVHFSSHPKYWPEGAKDEGYVIIRNRSQIRAIYWVGKLSDYSAQSKTDEY
jgi:hypothetical protein